MSIVKVEDIAHMRFAAPDLDLMRRFLTRFGLECLDGKGATLYARGTGAAPFVHATEPGAPGFRAIGFRCSSVADLARLAEAEGKKIEDFDAPGGGKILRLTDPDGLSVEVVAGQTPAPPRPSAPSGPWNDAAERRRLRRTVRLKSGPAHVHRLGHCVLAVSDFARSHAWYTSRFGFVASELFEAMPGVTTAAFLRCDRGSHPVDHHTLALVAFPGRMGFMHAGFEVADLDDLMLGHTHLRESGQDAHVRGIGRHILGSQVFDYWNDPWGHEVELWTDGDLFVADDPPNKPPLEELLSVQWSTAPIPMPA